MTQTPIKNALTVDVEDYFQVSAFENYIPRESWDSLPQRVDVNTNRVLDLFALQGVHATFFTLGWVAERFPDLVKRIVNEGHELASHGYSHRRVDQLSPQEFREEVIKTKDILQGLTGCEVRGYRAPSYSISENTLWALDILYETGHVYSSSIYPIKHDLYGMPKAPRFMHHYCDGKLVEVPISTVKLFGKTLPGGGGGFFRLYPYVVSRWAIRRVNDKDKQPGIFYFHPWEIDVDQPRQKQASLKSRFRHYLNLNRTEARLIRLLSDFNWDRMDTVFLNNNINK
ncbi:MAG: DUF3473 domain-containing protein [Gammaproteobacteria bacterium]|nr:DUF3473 domain-containing protein [Gammaproteobacteria bacterium]